MIKPALILIGIFQVLPLFIFGQLQIEPNDFKVGIFGATSSKTHFVNGCKVPFEMPLHNGYKTSVLNVLSEDGFNIYQTYAPNEWTSENYLKGYLKLSEANNFMVELGAVHYYKPAVDKNGDYLGYGTNVYNNCGNSIGDCQHPYSQNYFRANITKFLNNVFTVSPYKDIIWGYHICEEASYYHYQHFTNNCQGNVWEDPSSFKNIEVPPTNVYDAISYFKNNLLMTGVKDHKIVVMEANHHANINANTDDGEGEYNPQEYIHLLNKSDKRDVFFEGSYTQFPSSGWINQNYDGMYEDGYHYLGSFKSIDYAKNYSSEVHKVINVEGTSVHLNYLAHYHSNLSVPNANWLWFQAYTSIIHGADGIWFWDINYSWNSGEEKSWNNETIPNRFDRSFFPINYRNYTAYLAQELRFLADKNIISTDANTIIGTKTDVADPNCIVPPAESYIPPYLPYEKRTENYGLRYTIRTNGAETYMIISNPLNVAVDVSLNFSNSSNQHIQSSTGVDVLFDSNQHTVTSSGYKVNRNSNIILTNGTVAVQYYKGYTSNKQLNISFGPMDVKVLKFVSSPVNNNNGWNLVWSNYGSGKIHGHKVRNGDMFYIGDFDGDGTEELLCIGTTGGSNDWITLLKYVNDDWEWYWSNYGSTTDGDGIYPYRYNFIVGDYDGDGKDELLGNRVNGYTTLFSFSSGTWHWVWSDYGNSSHSIRPYKDKFYAGDFNGDGKDELLGCALPNGYTTTFKWNGSDFVWDWSDYGENHAIRQYRTNMLPGDFDGDGKVEMLGFSDLAALFHFGEGNWQSGWTSYGANNFAGWSYPLLTTDRVLGGNLDEDNKDELFFLQTHSTASWATTMDLKNDQSDWNWNWSANSHYSVPFIDDWPLASSGGSNTRYYLIKVKPNGPKYLLAMRKHCSNYLVSMYKTTNINNYRKENKKIVNNSIFNESENDVRVFPNPSDGRIQILSRKSDISYIDVRNITGQSVHYAKYNALRNVELELSECPAGIYILKILHSHNSVSIRKISINK